MKLSWNPSLGQNGSGVGGLEWRCLIGAATEHVRYRLKTARPNLTPPSKGQISIRSSLAQERNQSRTEKLRNDFNPEVLVQHQTWSDDLIDNVPLSKFPSFLLLLLKSEALQQAHLPLPRERTHQVPPPRHCR